VTNAASPDITDELRSRLDQMVDDARGLIEVESPSSDPAACHEAVEATQRLCADRLPSAARIETHGSRSVLRWGSATPRVLLLGHLDTVWPHGTLADIPFSATREDRGLILRGPGVFDMKVGVVQTIHALAAITDRLPDADVGLLLTTDEEIGSFDSKAAILASCARAEASLVMEPSVDGLFKNARKGTSGYEVVVHGRAAHAGLDPASGINAMLAMARIALAVVDVASPAAESTVTPTVAAAGTTENTVPERASVLIDVRAWTHDEQRRIDDAIRALAADPDLLQGARSEVLGGINRQAMPEVASMALVARARHLCDGLGITYPGARGVGGASDGNITAEAGVPTLDGLGAVGGGAHAVDEWALAEAMPERAALLTALVLDLLAG
jgi:glutamate carboxypeptidase